MGSERTRERSAPLGDQAAEESEPRANRGQASRGSFPVPYDRDPRRLAEFLQTAASLPPMLQDRVATQITTLLIEMRSAGNERAEALAILAALEARSFDGLYDWQGRSCRAVAVETLLTCGYPEALRVSPDDMAHFEAQKARGPTPFHPAATFAIMGAGYIAAALAARAYWGISELQLVGLIGFFGVIPMPFLVRWLLLRRVRQRA